jgi:16S rRNA (guanine966-N2)-methyltransferase
MLVRPTSDRLRETLFNVIAPRLAGARLMDLCAGSGAVGIEALSRGAAHVTFVDQARKMCALIESNLDLCSIPGDESEVILSEASEFLRHAPARRQASWDLIFFDPPYSTDYQSVLELFDSHSNELLAGEGLVIVEHHHKNLLKDEVGRLIRSRVLKQGDSSLSFYERQSG